MPRLLTSFFAALFLGLSLLSASAEDFTEEYEAVISKTRKLFEKGDWEALDKFADQCRDEKLTLTCGEPKLMQVYRGLDVDNHLEKSAPDKEWLAWLDKLAEWEKANPESVTLPAVKIEFWVSYGWRARGSGAAKAVRRNAGEIYRERLEQAGIIFERATLPLGQERYPCPGLYEAMMSVALGQNWSIEDTDAKLLTPLIQLYPEYIDGYRSFARGLKRQWGGKDGDEYLFYQSLPGRIAGPVGKEVYARVLIKQKLYAVVSYRDDLVDWDKVLEGMVESVRRYPRSSHQLMESVKFAHRHQGQKELLERLEIVSPEAVEKFYHTTELGSAFKANQSDLRSHLVHEGYFNSVGVLGVNRVRSIAAQPEKGSFFATFGTAGLHELSVSGEVLSSSKFDPRRCMGSIAISPDDSVLFACSIYDRNYGKEDSLLQIWSIAEEPRRLERELSFTPGFLNSPVITPDSEKVIFNHYLETPKGFAKNSSLYVWDWQEDGSKPRQFLAGKKNVNYRNLQIDEENGFLYFTTKVLMRLPLDDLDQEPKIIGAKAFSRPDRILNFAIPEGKSFCIALVQGKKKVLSLLAMDLNTGEILGKKVLKEIVNDGYSLQLTRSEETNEDLIVTSGRSGTLTCWSYQSADGKVTFAYDSTLPSNGDPTWTLQAMPNSFGKNYILQGLEHGLVGVFSVK